MILSCPHCLDLLVTGGGNTSYQGFAAGVPIATLPGCVTPARPDRYPGAILADDYLRERLREIKLIS